MFGIIRDYIVAKTIDSENPKINKIIGLFGDSIVGILESISQIYYKIEGIENIPLEGNFILIANHPSPLDYFGIKGAFERLGIEVRFVVHANFIEHPFTKNISDKNKFIGVRRYDYKKPEKIESAKRVNLKGLKEAKEHLEEGGNIGIFIGGEGYLPGLENIFKGYRFIAKKSNTSTLLPIVISKGKIHILKAYNLPGFHDDDFIEIEKLMKKSLIEIQKNSNI